MASDVVAIAGVVAPRVHAAELDGEKNAATPDCSIMPRRCHSRYVEVRRRPPNGRPVERRVLETSQMSRGMIGSFDNGRKDGRHRRRCLADRGRYRQSSHGPHSVVAGSRAPPPSSTCSGAAWQFGGTIGAWSSTWPAASRRRATAMSGTCKSARQRRQVARSSPTTATDGTSSTSVLSG